MKNTGRHHPATILGHDHIDLRLRAVDFGESSVSFIAELLSTFTEVGAEQLKRQCRCPAAGGAFKGRGVGALASRFGANDGDLCLLLYTGFLVIRLRQDLFPSTAALQDEKKRGEHFAFPSVALAS